MVFRSNHLLFSHSLWIILAVGISIMAGTLFTQDAQALGLCSTVGLPSIRIDVAGQSFFSPGGGSITVTPGTVLSLHVSTFAEPGSFNNVSYPFQSFAYGGPSGNIGPGRDYTTAPIDSFSTINAYLQQNCEADPDPQPDTSIQININVEAPPPPPPGTIHVSSNRNTSWQVSGPEDFGLGSGTNATYSTSNFGTYAISVADINCFDKSVSPGSMNVTSGSDQTFSITYTDNGSCNNPPPPPPVDGVCSNPPTHYTCAAGSLGGTAEYPSPAAPDFFAYQWWCNGINGSSNNQLCTESKSTPPPTAPIGVCSGTHYNCSVGTAINGSDNPTNWTWVCRDTGGDASCSETKPPPGTVTPVCSGTHYNCSVGTAINGSDNPTNWTWVCRDTGGDASCSETKPAPSTCQDSQAQNFNGPLPCTYLPVGNVDAGNCSIIGGWSYDPDISGSSIDVHIYRDGPAGSGVDPIATLANGDRPDVRAAFGISGNHGFTVSTPEGYKDGNAHSGFVYGIGEGGGGDARLIGTFNIAAGQCLPPPEPTPPLTPPTGLSGSCAVGATQVNLSWNLPAGYTKSLFRIQDNGAIVHSLSINESRPDNGPATTVPVTAGHSYHWWVHTANNDHTDWSDPSSADFSCPVTPVLGCTNPTAVNFNAAANTDDGSCTFNCSGPSSQSCASSANACGQTSTGTQSRVCDHSTGNWIGGGAFGACSASAPANPAGLGNACTGSASAPNACGMTNPGSSGTIQCNGLCSGDSGSTPANSSCPPPTASSATQSDPDYCQSGPGGFIAWTYSDPNNSPQSAYQIQITTTGNFNSPMYDSGQINSGSHVFAIPNGVLGFNTTYKARVRTWNTFTAVSAWSGPTSSWKTPIYAYPNVIPPAQFTWPTSPAPQQNQSIQFTDHTIFGGGNSNSRTWSWNFGDGNTSTQQNPAHTYPNIGNYSVTQTVTDAANQTCAFSRTINIQKPIPKIKEVAPR